MRVYFIFRSTHETLKAESTLQAAALACKVVMKPAAILSDCGLAVRVSVELRDQAVSVLALAGVGPRGTFVL